MGILEGVKWKTSQADYNGPKQQWIVRNKNKQMIRYTLFKAEVCFSVLSVNLNTGPTQRVISSRYGWLKVMD